MNGDNPFPPGPVEAEAPETPPLAYWVNVYRLRGWKHGMDGTIDTDACFPTQAAAVAGIVDQMAADGRAPKLGVSDYLHTLRVTVFSNGNSIASVLHLWNEAVALQESWAHEKEEASRTHAENMRHISAERQNL